MIDPNPRPQIANAADSSAVIFLHIPKCGGTSFLDFLRANVPQGTSFDVNEGADYPGRLRELAALSLEDRSRLRFVYGHLPWGVHHVLPQPATYVALLRHPVDRLISHYCFVKEDPQHHLYEAVMRERMSLVDYVQSGLTGELDNGQTRLLCGRPDLDSLHGHAPVSRAHLAEALEHLLSDRMRFGLMEFYDASQRVIARSAGWPQPQPPTRKNVTRNRLPMSAISRRDWQAIVDGNQLAMELYRTAFREFARRAARCGVAVRTDGALRQSASFGGQLLERLRPSSGS